MILALYGFNALVFTAVFVWRRWLMRPPAPPAPPAAWPTVTVQLPIYNERYVVERVIDAVAALDYPTSQLTIQVLDDSTDDTAGLARAKVAHHRARGLNIEYIQRPARTGYKAGALAYGLRRSTAEFVCVFDADFVPQPDFLRRVIPHFTAGRPGLHSRGPLAREQDVCAERVGMVQARWGHLNDDYSLLTRAQAFFLDAHFGVEQIARNESGLFINFNGSAGVWRRACIEDAGGWKADTIAEDLDLSYRAQLRGWKLRCLPDLVVPAEVPTQLGAFKRQQFRWAKGSIQVLRKLGGQLLNSNEPLVRKFEGLLHLAGYIVHPLMMLVVILSLPLVVTGEFTRVHLGAIGLAGFGAPVMCAIAQIALYPKDWQKCLIYLPAILFLGPGLALSNTAAIFEALIGRNPTLFLRTPKYPVEGRFTRAKEATAYILPVDWTTWAEIFFMFYSALTTAFAMQLAPGLAPFTASYAIGFAYAAYLGIRQSFAPGESIEGAMTTD
jgi:cellulose synthase/poly-beta-1,6-N-acetylglucosamine synthase-like glycosyltransferase